MVQVPRIREYRHSCEALMPAFSEDFTLCQDARAKKKTKQVGEEEIRAILPASEPGIHFHGSLHEAW